MARRTDAAARSTLRFHCAGSSHAEAQAWEVFFDRYPCDFRERRQVAQLPAQMGALVRADFAPTATPGKNYSQELRDFLAERWPQSGPTVTRDRERRRERSAEVMAYYVMSAVPMGP